MLDSIHRVLGDTDDDWEITYEATPEWHERGLQEFRSGQIRGFAMAMYGRTFSPGTDDFSAKTANDLLGLPKESLYEATKETIDMVQSGWNSFA